MMKQNNSNTNRENIYLNIIRKTIPNIDSEKIQIFDDGWDYVVIVINNEVAFRFPRREDYAKTLPIETKFLEHFANKSPVRIPKLTYQKDEETGISYVTYDFIPGVQFTKKISSTFTKDEILSVAKQLGLFLTAVHSFPVEKAKEFGVQQIDSLNSWQKRLTKIRKGVFPYISEKEQQWVIKLFEDFLKSIMKTPIKSVLTHSDIMPEHIIVDPETHTLSGIIDFGDLCIADPAYDFTFLARYGQDFLSKAYENYKLPRNETFETRRKFYEDRLVVTNLEHSLELRDRERIEMHKNELLKYVEAHPV